MILIEIQTAGAPSAILAFVHGFSDHAGRYGDFFPNLAANGIEVRVFDQRGWGKSVKKPTHKGLTGPTTQVLADITTFLQTMLPSSVPLFLGGHSMGGGEVLTYAAQGPADVRKQIAGYIASAPLIGLHPDAQPGAVTVFMGKLAGKVLPNRQMVSKLDSSHMSHDPEANKAWEDDELCHDTGTLEGMSGMLDRGSLLDSGKVMIEDTSCSVLVLHGTGDMVTSHEASKRFIERCKVQDKTLKLYDGAYHCGMFDLTFFKE
jgi:acylglycerol lipase